MFGEVVFQYTRKQAIEDGIQVDLNKLSKLPSEHWKYPVFATTEVMAKIYNAVEKSAGASLDGYLHDIFFLAKKRYKELNPGLRSFECLLGGEDVELMLQVGPTDIDDPAPAITVMMPWEY